VRAGNVTRRPGTGHPTATAAPAGSRRRCAVPR
jgi:hypothetical protein